MDGEQRVFETNDPTDREMRAESDWALDWKTTGRPVEVVKHGFLYRAEGWFLVRPGSPHRAMFTSGEGRAVAWGRSAESAGARCDAKRRRRVSDDERVWQERQARTSTYRERR